VKTSFLCAMVTLGCCAALGPLLSLWAESCISE